MNAYFIRPVQILKIWLKNFQRKNLFFSLFCAEFSYVPFSIFWTCLIHNGAVKRVYLRLATLRVLIESRCGNDNNQHQSCNRVFCGLSTSVTITPNLMTSQDFRHRKVMLISFWNCKGLIHLVFDRAGAHYECRSLL